MIPMMIDHALKQPSKDVLAGRAIPNHVLRQHACRQHVEPQIGGLGDGAPCGSHLVERGCAGWRAVHEQLER
jgi:hypothetical protein